MTISEPDPKSNLIQFKRAKHQGTLEPIRSSGGCRHERCTVDEEKRIVACCACQTILDPFTVLYELAWKQRRWLEELDAWDAYRDSKLSERYDQVWQERKGDIIEPPQDPETRRVWNVFDKYFGERFCGMYRLKARKREGPLWYGRSVTGGCVSFDYAQRELMTKAVAAKS